MALLRVGNSLRGQVLRVPSKMAVRSPINTLHGFPEYCTSTGAADQTVKVPLGIFRGRVIANTATEMPECLVCPNPQEDRMTVTERFRLVRSSCSYLLPSVQPGRPRKRESELPKSALPSTVPPRLIAEQNKSCAEEFEASSHLRCRLR